MAITIKHIYPASRRPWSSNTTEQKDVHNSRVFTEENITNIIKNATDYDSYIADATKRSDGSYDIKLIFKGYYFDVQGITAPATAWIEYDENYKELIWRTEGGLIINNGTGVSPEQGGTMYSFVILDNNGNLGNLYKLRASSVDINITKISCGTL